MLLAADALQPFAIAGLMTVGGPIEKMTLADLVTRPQKVVSRSWWKSKKGVKIRRVEPQLTPAGRRVPEDDAMESDSRSAGPGKGALEELMRERIRASSRASSLRNWRRRWVRQHRSGSARFELATGTASAHAR